MHDNECGSATQQSIGQLSGEVQDGLQDELGDNRIRVLQTGVAGENKVAAIVNELRHYHGAGLGRGDGQEPQSHCHAARSASAPITATAPSAWRSGSATTTTKSRTACTCTAPPGTSWGWTPTASCPAQLRDGSFEHAKAIAGATISDTIWLTRTCFSCLVACKARVEVPERGVIPKYGGMEYEIIGALGSVCGVGDMEAVAKPRSGSTAM